MIKNTRKYFLKFFGIVFFLSLFLFNFSFSLTNEEFLAKLPYNVNFTEAELKLLKTLSPTDLEKIIKIATLVKQQSLDKSKILNNQKLAEQARLNAQNNGNNLNDPNNPNNPNNPANAQQKPSLLDTLFGKQPTATSPFQTPQTPFYNPATGQFQDTPASNGGIFGSLLGGGNTGRAATPGFSTSPGSEDQYGNNTPLDPSNAKGCPATIPAFCDDNLGVTVTGECSEKNLSSPPVSPKLKGDLRCVCAILGKKIVSASVYRNRQQQQCANPKVKSSQHTAGTAIDFSYKTVSPKKAMEVFFYFKSNGYRHGCYRGKTTHVHFDHGGGSNYFEGPCPAILNAVLQGYKK